MGSTKFILGMRDVYFNELYKVMLNDKNSIFITADNGAPTLDKFADDMPDQYYQVGIAEEHMIGMAAGLAREGRKVYVYSIAPFVTQRVSEFIKLDVCASNLPIVIIGIGAGYSYELDGPTHHTVEDITCMRSYPNLKIYSPSDSFITKALVNVVHNDISPIYMRFDRTGIPDLYGDVLNVEKFINDGLVKARTGKDKYAIFTTGRFVHNAIEIANKLSELKNVDFDVIDLFRIKPLNEKILLEYVSQYDKIVTYEEHLLAGGLGSAILELLNDAGKYKPTLRIGVNDRFVFDMGGREDIWAITGIDVLSAVEKIINWLKI